MLVPSYLAQYESLPLAWLNRVDPVKSQKMRFSLNRFPSIFLANLCLAVWVVQSSFPAKENEWKIAYKVQCKKLNSQTYLLNDFVFVASMRLRCIDHVTTFDKVSGISSIILLYFCFSRFCRCRFFAAVGWNGKKLLNIMQI